MISHIPYLYADAGGFKQFGDIYLTPALAVGDLEKIESKLQDGEFFIPGQLGLGIPELQSANIAFPSDLDHVFHVLQLEQHSTLLAAAPDGEQVIDAQAFLASFEALAGPGAWDVVTAHRRLGL